MRAPVVENLQAANQHVRLLDIDPVVADQPAILVSLVPDLQLGAQQPDSDEVTIDQPFTHLAYRHGNVDVQRPDKFLNRHRRKEIIAGKLLLVAVFVASGYACDAKSVDLHSSHVEIGNDRPAQLDDLLRDHFPHLSGPKFGIKELFDQGSFGVFLRAVTAVASAEHLLDVVCDRLED